MIISPRITHSRYPFQIIEVAKLLSVRPILSQYSASVQIIAPGKVLAVCLFEHHSLMIVMILYAAILFQQISAIPFLNFAALLRNVSVIIIRDCGSVITNLSSVGIVSKCFYCASVCLLYLFIRLFACLFILGSVHILDFNFFSCV